jgi:hypothetical protein
MVVYGGKRGMVGADVVVYSRMQQKSDTNLDKGGKQLIGTIQKITEK